MSSFSNSFFTAFVAIASNSFCCSFFSSAVARLTWLRFISCSSTMYFAEGDFDSLIVGEVSQSDLITLIRFLGWSDERLTHSRSFMQSELFLMIGGPRGCLWRKRILYLIFDNTIWSLRCGQLLREIYITELRIFFFWRAREKSEMTRRLFLFLFYYERQRNVLNVVFINRYEKESEKI